MAQKITVRELITKLGFEGDFKNLDKFESRFASTMRTAKRLAIGIAGLAGSLAVFLKKPADFEQTKIAFETLLGGADAAEKKLKELRDFATRTPFTLEGINKNSKLLLGMGIEAENLVPTMKFLGDVSSGLSVPMERLALNLGQVKAQGKLTGRELRDFAVAGVPLLDELSKQLGKSKAEVQSMISAGKIGFPEVEKAFVSMTSEGGKFANLMDKQANSTFGIFSNIQDVLTNILIDGGGNLLKNVKELAIAFKSYLEINKEILAQKLDVFVGKLFKALKGGIFIVTRVFNVMDRLASLFGGWGNLIEWTTYLLGALFGAQFLITMGTGLQALTGMINGFKLLGNSALGAQLKAIAVPLAIGAAFAGILLVIEDIFSFFKGDSSILGDAIDSWDNSTRKWRRTLALVLLPLRAITTTISTIAQSLGALFGGGGFSAVGQIIKSNFGKLFANSDELTGRQLAGFNQPEIGPDINDLITNNNSSSQTKVEAPISITVPPNTTQEQAVDMITKGLDSVFGKTLNNARVQVSSPIKE